MIDNKRCILIANDEPKMVRALRDFFRANGFCVLEAKDGIEAMDVFCENSANIDVILLDVMMPRQDELTTLREIRDASSLTPVILLTAKGEEYDQLSGFSCGADDYITKPFSPSLLMARVEAVLRRFGERLAEGHHGGSAFRKRLEPHRISFRERTGADKARIRSSVLPDRQPFPHVFQRAASR